MTSDLISRDALIRDMYEDGYFPLTVADKATEKIMKQPTVDAVEVVQRLWKKTTEEKPNSSRHLIVTDGGLISHYGYYVKPKDKWFKTWECKEEIPEPAFWMDMPEPPKESILDECCC